MLLLIKTCFNLETDHLGHAYKQVTLLYRALMSMNLRSVDVLQKLKMKHRFFDTQNTEMRIIPPHDHKCNLLLKIISLYELI